MDESKIYNALNSLADAVDSLQIAVDDMAREFNVNGRPPQELNYARICINDARNAIRSL
jgi:hypothetical protein